MAEDDTIVVTRTDKGRGTVILNKEEYISKLNSLLADQTKFKLITDDTYKTVLSLEEKLNRILRKIKDKLAVGVYDTIRATGSIPGTLYGLVKIHKSGYPIRPIISSINTFNYRLAKYLTEFLTSITTNMYTISNTASFLADIRKEKFSSSVVFASFDVVSLFTNIPVKETIQIATDKL